MKVLNLRHELVSGAFRQSTVDLEFGDGSREELWFRVPEEVPPPENGNAWLALALPLATVLGEDLHIDLPVDAWLKLNAETVLAIWRHWYPDLAKAIQIHAETLPPGLPKPGVASSFTAGVDSFFTVLRHTECKHYIHVLGLDMPLWKKEAHARLTARLEHVAAQMGARFYRLATNLRETRWGKLPWETFASGAALAGSQLQLESLAGTGLIPSSELTPEIPWGTHPLTDPLFSTSLMRILHDGLSHNRLEKIEYVVQFPIVLDNLHVCFVGVDTHGQDDRNCSRCGKCVRNMLALDAIGKLYECKTFDLSQYRVELAAQLAATSTKGRIILERLRELAERYNRADIVRCLDESLRKSRVLKALKRFERTPLLWRLPVYYRRCAFGAIAVLQYVPATSRPASSA